MGSAGAQKGPIMADVFISYSSEDRERVRPLAAALEARGFSVWWDRALAAGDDYANVIAKALADSKASIVVWSRVSVESPWVRDEAAHAREANRLVPVLFDKVQIPLGFGAINAEDFTKWNGKENAPQVDLLAESLRARIAGVAPDGARIQAKRRRVGLRIQIVSILSVLAVGAAGVGGVLQILDRNKPAPIVAAPQKDSLSQLLDLVSEGKLTGDQAVELSKLLQQQAFADVPTPAADQGAPADSSAPMSMAATSEGAAADDVQLASVSEAELNASAKSSFSDAAAQLLQDPDPDVRAAAVQAANPQKRQEGLDKLWALAAKNGPSSAAIYRYCAALGVVTDDPRAPDALERARDLNPQDRRLWKMLSFSYQKRNDMDAARGAALVGAGLEKSATGKEDEAAQTFEKALPLLKDGETKAFVLGQLGDVAAKRDDWSAAEEKYKAAVELHVRSKDVAGIAVDAPKLARAQQQQGDAAKACDTLKKAQAQGADTVQAQADQTCADAKAPAPALKTAPIIREKGVLAPRPYRTP
jgi:tetratricopeptide (TPR) repeat protein